MVWIVLLLVILLIFVLFLVAGKKFFDFAFASPAKEQAAMTEVGEPDGLTPETKKRYMDGAAWIKAQEKQLCTITSRDGLQLRAHFLPAQNPMRIMILCHGWKGSAEGDFSGIAKWYQENGCSMLLLEERAQHGSEGKYMTFGAWEKRDITDWTWYVEEYFNAQKLPLYLHGVSMGAASVLLASGENLPKSVAGIIADCGYSSISQQFSYLSQKWFHIPAYPLLYFVNIWCHVLGHFSIWETQVEEVMKQASLPILFLHGTEDEFVPSVCSQVNFDACVSPKKLVWIEGAAHAISQVHAPEVYRQAVAEFLENFTGK